MLKTRQHLTLFFVLWVGIANAQVDTLRIATYNLLKFPYNNSSKRIPYFRTVIRSIKPDILVVQELQSGQGLLTFLNEVMNYDRPNVYRNAPYVDGPDTDNGLFYKFDKAKLLGMKQIRTDLRNVSEYIIEAKDVEFRLYSLHLKAGTEPSDESRRLTEAITLRNYLNTLPANSNFIVAGDFNLSGSSEPAFIKLTGSETDNDGQLWDPKNAVGTWNNNGLFAAIHTQSTRTVLVDSGATGGLDDRFDLMLVSNSLLSAGGMDILAGTYKAFGNDGRHFNQAINFGHNTVVPDSVANALYFASDHLPIFADFIIGMVNAVENPRVDSPPVEFSLLQNSPNPFSATSQTEIHFSLPIGSEVRLEVFNLLGERVVLLVDDKLAAGGHLVRWNGRNATGQQLASGVYFYRLQASNHSSRWTAVRKMVVVP